ncbi:MAG TPA: GNAT family N-acetyltransferase [Paludibacteraceae bacterium]|nr:GNAT family N-acetyltransferase [Paludibacteraceae bacterium]
MENITVNSPVRFAKKEDIDAIHHLLDMEPFKYDNSLPYQRSWIKQLIMNKRCITLVYETEGIIKGFISGEKLVSGSVMIWFCAVKKEYQHRVIGGRLYFEFENVCKQIGIKGILAYGYKTSVNMLRKLQFFTNEKKYLEFYKVL